MNATTSVLIACLFFSSGDAFAQSINKEPAAVVELGGATSWDVKDGGRSLGPDFAVEFTPIENWLEVEAGTTPLFRPHSTEWDTDLLFKKPWTLSNKVEFMFGVVPEWIHTRQYSISTNSVGAEAVLDLMFSPSAKHKFGWFLEPGCEYNFGPGHEKSIGVSAGLLIAIPRQLTCISQPAFQRDSSRRHAAGFVVDRAAGLNCDHRLINLVSFSQDRQLRTEDFSRPARRA